MRRRRRKKRRTTSEASVTGDVFRLPVVEVVWRDAVTTSQWRQWEEADEITLPECRTVGRLVRKNRDRIVLASTVNSEGGLGVTWVIPRPWVLRYVRGR